MKLTLELNNRAKSPIKIAVLKKIAENTLKESEYEFLSEKNISVSFALVEKEEIQKINKTYRRKNSPTDVLSFAEYKSAGELKKACGKDLFLGEIIMCYDDISEYAKKSGLKVSEEFAKAASHGILHLLGFSHGRNMFTIQEKAASKNFK